MFNSDDIFWSILDYIKCLRQVETEHPEVTNTSEQEIYIDSFLDPDLESLDSATRPLARSARDDANMLFSKTLDRMAFSSPDYSRLRNFLIDWYAALKTITIQQRNITDVYTHTHDMIEELIRSFGYNFLPQYLTLTQKQNFFLGLVELYQIKGSPESIMILLKALGINVEVYEYYLECYKEETTGDDGLYFDGDEAGTQRFLRFVGYSTETGERNDSMNYNYKTIVDNDPHWFYKDQKDILQFLKDDKLSLPTKTRYFSINPGTQLNILKGILSVICSKFVKDYDYYNSLSDGTTNPFPPEPSLRLILLDVISSNYYITFFECMLAFCYVFNKYYGPFNFIEDSTASSLCYSGPIDESDPVIPGVNHDTGEIYPSELLVTYGESLEDPTAEENRIPYVDYIGYTSTDNGWKDIYYFYQYLTSKTTLDLYIDSIITSDEYETYYKYPEWINHVNTWSTRFTNGIGEPSIGEIIIGRDSGATGVISSIDLLSGDWTSAGAVGILYITDKEGVFIEESVDFTSGSVDIKTDFYVVRTSEREVKQNLTEEFMTKFTIPNYETAPYNFMPILDDIFDSTTGELIDYGLFTNVCYKRWKLVAPQDLDLSEDERFQQFLTSKYNLKYYIDQQDPDVIEYITGKLNYFIQNFIEEVLDLNSEDIDYQSIFYYIFGFDNAISSNIIDSVNFFKPYRTKLMDLKEIVAEDDMGNCIRFNDVIGNLTLTQTIVDWPSTNSYPCCNEDMTSCFELNEYGPDATSLETYDPRWWYDCDGYYDRGIVWDLFVYNTSEYYYDNAICLDSDELILQYIWPSDSTSLELYDGTAYIQTEVGLDNLTIYDYWKNEPEMYGSMDVPSAYYLQQSGFPRNFDEGFEFDACTSGFDICQIYIEERTETIDLLAEIEGVMPDLSARKTNGHTIFWIAYVKNTNEIYVNKWESDVGWLGEVYILDGIDPSLFIDDTNTVNLIYKHNDKVMQRVWEVTATPTYLKPTGIIIECHAFRGELGNNNLIYDIITEEYHDIYVDTFLQIGESTLYWEEETGPYWDSFSFLGYNLYQVLNGVTTKVNAELIPKGVLYTEYTTTLEDGAYYYVNVVTDGGGYSNVEYMMPYEYWVYIDQHVLHLPIITETHSSAFGDLSGKSIENIYVWDIVIDETADVGTEFGSLRVSGEYKVIGLDSSEFPISSELLDSSLIDFMEEIGFASITDSSSIPS